MFLIAVLVGLPALLMIANLEQIPQDTSADQEPPGPIWDLLKDKGILVLAITSFLSGVALLTSYLFGGIYMQQLGGSETAVGLMFGLSALAEVPVMQRSGLLMARYGGPQTLALALILASLAVGFHAVAWSPTVLVLASVVKGFGVGIVLVALISIANERAPKAWASTAQSVVGGCFFGLAPLVTSIPSGLIFDRWGGSALFTVASLSALVGFAVLWIGIRKDWFQPRRRPLV